MAPMSIARLCEAIESHKMAAEVNVASNLRVVLDIITGHPIVRELAKELKNPGVAERILFRVLQLSEQATDVRYENPNDTALMIYAWLLNQYDHRLAFLASGGISQVPNLWWASKVATKILEGRFEQNEMAGAASTSVTRNAHAGDRLFAAGTRFYSLTPAPLLRGSVGLGVRERTDVRTRAMSGGQLAFFPVRGSAFTILVESTDSAEHKYVAA